MALLPSIGCYVRLSVHADDAEVQRSGMTHWLREQQIAPVTTQWFEDVDYAEATDYLAYEALHEAIFTGRINTVVVWSFECLFLRLKDAVNTLAIWCGRGVRVVSVLHKIDLQEPAHSIFVPVMLSLTELEEGYRRKRQATGIAAAKERGVYQGRMRGATKAEPQWARRLRQRGLTIAQIALTLHVNERTVYSYLASQHPESIIES
jgi:DNA invertase Pin-like site-specific DNA recombinase